MGTGEYQVCDKCHKEKSIDEFDILKYNGKQYHIHTCKKCRYEIRKAKKNALSNNIDILIKRKYKEIRPERILDLSLTNIEFIEYDEIFVKLIDYRDIWLSNYERVIQKKDDTYVLVKLGYDSNGAARCVAYKDTYVDGKWVYKKSTIYIAKMVVQEFVVNADMRSNVFIWHKGMNKDDNYYKHLYPLNKEQYRIVKTHYMETGDDSEEFIVKVMNDRKFKPDYWSKPSMKPTIAGKGYRGGVGVDVTSRVYKRWCDMLQRCYNAKFHARNPQYMNCYVCEEWLNFQNFKIWYEAHDYGEESQDLDKDILIKGNTMYSPETCCLAPHIINTLIINGTRARGNYPLGVYFDNEKNKFRASLAVSGEQIKLGYYDTPEEAFARYKKYKEDFIQDLAEQYKEEIPHKLYDALMNWKIEITD